jgi:hypothetical protein
VFAGQVQARSAAPVDTDGQHHQRHNAFGHHGRRAQQLAVVGRVCGFGTGDNSCAVFNDLGARRPGGHHGGLGQKGVAQACGGVQHVAAVGILQVQAPTVQVLQAQHGVQNGAGQRVAVGAAHQHVGKRHLQAVVCVGADQRGHV